MSELQAFEYYMLQTKNEQEIRRGTTKPGVRRQGARGCSKLLAEVLGFTKYITVTSAGVELGNPSRKGTSNCKDWYKQTSSSLQ